MPATDSKPVSAPTPPATSGGTVTVACKHPMGLELRTHVRTTMKEPMFGGGYRDVEIWVPDGHSVTVAGPKHPWNEAPRDPIFGGYALTFGVSADFWAAWLEQNKDTALVRNRIVYAHEKTEHVQGVSKEQAEVRSGLEPIDRNNLPKGVRTFSPKDNAP